MRPTLFEIGSFKVPSFGILVMLGFLAGLWLARKRAPRYGMSPDFIADTALWMLIAGILGARIAFILQEIPYYSQNPDKLLTLKFEGMTSFGGVIAGFLVLWWKAKRDGISVLRILDGIGPGFLVGHAMGRIGCLFNGCCHGPRCDAWWGVPVVGRDGLYQPAQVYDALMNLAGLALIYLFFNRKQLGQGAIIGMVFVVHGLSRFIYEFWRAGVSSTTMGNLPLTEAHVAALIIAVIGAVLWVRSRSMPPSMVEVGA
jgi:phosphatidylglycerol:prolipoprotein diacylglycerol transferase